MKVRDLVAEMGRPVKTIEAAQTVEEAISLMSEAGASALIVMEAGRPAGIFAERDVLRCHLKNRKRRFELVSVGEAMTSKLIVAEPEEAVSAAMATMIRSGIRHLPVIENGRIVGMLTIGDLVEHQVGTLTAEIHYLQDYISDLQDANLD
jgi:CBS domain-containing protein